MKNIFLTIERYVENIVVIIFSIAVIALLSFDDGFIMEWIKYMQRLDQIPKTAIICVCAVLAWTGLKDLI